MTFPGQSVYPFTGINLLKKLIINHCHFKLYNYHNFSKSMQVGQQHGGNAVTIATADKQRRQDEEKTSMEAVLEGKSAFLSTSK